MIISGNSGLAPEVDPRSLAVRVAPRPMDGDTVASYSAVLKTGTMAAGLAADSPILSLRWGAPSTAGRLLLLRRITASINSLGTGFAAGVGRLEAYIARTFSAGDSGGTIVTLSGLKPKRTSMPATQLGDLRISSTATLTAGTRTPDASPVGVRVFPVTTATNFVHLATSDLFYARPDEWPLVFADNEGVVVQATVPATGTWQGVISIDWDEVPAGHY